MSFDEFKKTLKDPAPPKLGLALTALWYDGKDDWEHAHNLVADINTKEAAAVHAYLHRKEGDDGNASYWYSRAGRKFSNGTLESEWATLVQEFLLSS